MLVSPAEPLSLRQDVLLQCVHCVYEGMNSVTRCTLVSADEVRSLPTHLQHPRLPGSPSFLDPRGGREFVKFRPQTCLVMFRTCDADLTPCFRGLKDWCDVCHCDKNIKIYWHKHSYSAHLWTHGIMNVSTSEKYQRDSEDQGRGAVQQPLEAMWVFLASC